ncbi:hypothetical protein NDA16_003902 [Ustilago loliicola]|nr:hypothetical protein NDA16_003902 [Ustilago loliicola]
MAPHPPSSPITSEHPSEDLELKLKHGIQSASQVASTSRTTIDNSDAAGRPIATNKPESSSSTSSLQNPTPHTQFPDWQEQRRCHSILAEYDYVQPTEDRRDPRSSNARLVMPVSSSQQPQVMVTSAAPHDMQSNDASSQTHLQTPPPIAIHPDEHHHSTTLTNAGEDSTKAKLHRSTPLQGTLSQSSTSVPPSPERAISPSPSFSDFGYQPPSTHGSPCFASSIPRPRPRTSIAEKQLNHDSSSLSIHAQQPGSLKEPQAVQQTNSATASSSMLPASANARPWLRTSSLQFDELTRRKPVPQSSQGRDAPSHTSSASHKVFQLQPVPPAKRRKLEDASTLSAKESRLSTIDETRRSSDAGICFNKAQSQSSRSKTTATPQGIMANGAVQALSSKTEAKYASSQVQVADANRMPAVPALASSRRTNLVGSDAISKAAPPSGSSVSASNRSGAENASSLASLARPRKPFVSSSSRRPRLVRAKSVPNLRAKATLDISAPSHHRLILPSHWASHASSHSRQGREGHNATSKGSNARPSKGFAFNLAHYPTASSSSRSRSTFTPTLHPPITRHTLRELDLFEILKNPQLRHDVVFDPNVQFRPNFDGERGRRKREAGERYWTAVVREIETGCTCTAFSHGQLLPCTCKAKDRSRNAAGMTSKQDAVASGTNGQSRSLASSRIPSRIPLLVQELRTICLSILPSNYPADSALLESDEASAASSVEQQKTSEATESSSTEKKASTSASTGSTTWATTHHQLIAQTLDPHLISQELQHGVLDVPALITFMGSVLKLHCAPMRDEAIEKMVEVVCVDRNIGKGLRLCFEILELMKLDIANHQLRSARPFLVETAADFEIRWFKEQIEQGKMSLDKTTTWIQQALATCWTDGAAAAASRSETVVKAFNCGMLQLIFDVPGSVPVLSPVATPLGSPSSSSLNNTFAAHYPETFQFDAYRMMTFHNDVSDLTIVYMLVLLFRQLCSTPLDDAGALPASVGSIVQKQLKSIKGEIWCLVNDANLCLSSSGTFPATPNATTSGAGNSRVDGKVLLGSAGRLAKLDHPRWRRAMQNVLLQVAARASAVQSTARAGGMDPSNVKAAAPSAATQKVLNSWMDTNLRTGSALHKICQSRLRDVVLGMLTEKVRSGLLPSSSSSSTVPSTSSGAEESGRKRVHTDEDTASKRVKSDMLATLPSSETATSSANGTAASTWDTTLSRAGLEPFAAEIRLLSDRIAKVATFHLRVFRNLYEGIEVSRTKTSSSSL